MMMTAVKDMYSPSLTGSDSQKLDLSWGRNSRVLNNRNNAVYQFNGLWSDS